MFQNKEYLLILSTQSFFIPLVLSIFLGQLLHSVIIFLVIVFSVTYHHHLEKKYEVADTILAYALISFNLYLCYLGRFYLPTLSVALVFTVLAFYYKFFKKGEYKVNHSWWHIYSALITLFSLLTYLFGKG